MRRLVRTASRTWFSVRALLLRRRLDEELDEELAFHLEREAALHATRGMSPAEAHREAARRFGGVQRYREECRDVRQMSWLDDLRSDARFALRLVRLHPGFSANVIIIAALGIAACVTTFSLVSGILLSPLPFPGQDRVALLHLQSADGNSSAALPLETYARLAAGSPVLSAIAASRPSGASVEWNNEPEEVSTGLVTASFFQVFGITPFVGRAFTDDEARSRAPVALLGYDAWRTRFAGDPAAIGKRVTIDNEPYTIIGVMPPRFRAHFSSDRALWLPWSPGGDGPAGRRPSVNAMVRMADTVTKARAEAWLATVVRGQMPSSTHNDSVSASPTLVPISDLVYGGVERPLFVLLGAVLLVLLLVSANVATMFLARSSARERELDVRRALGASGSREMRQLVTESVTLTALGGLLGVIVSVWSVVAVRGLGVKVLPRMDAVSIDWRVLLFAIAGTVLTGIVGGLAPALVSRRRRTIAAGHDASAGRGTDHRTSSMLVVAQIALSVVLLVGAGLLMKGFLRVLPTDPGFALEHRAVLMATLRSQPAYPDSDRAAARRFVSEVSDRMRRVRGVRDVAMMSFPPFLGSASIAEIRVPGRPAPAKPFNAFQNLVSENYFDVMRIPMRSGRSFTTRDSDGSDPVAIVNETAASRWWPGETPIGRSVVVSRGRTETSVTVVGVSRDGRLMGQDTKVRPEIYLPMSQGNPRFVTFIAHTSVDPPLLARELQRAVWSVAPRLPIETTTDLASIASESLRTTRFFSVAMSSFATVAVGLSGLGIYGLLAFAVARRRREIGIRIALGAPATAVGGSVLRRALVLGMAGVASGIILARWLSRYLESLLLEVGATDATVFTATAIGVLFVALLAACAPVVQAVRVDPIKSLRV